MSIPVFRPTLRRRDFNSVLGCLVSDRIGSGPLCHELAGELSRYLGAAGGLCLATYTAAIQRALDALELAPKDRVIISALAPSEYLQAAAGRGLTAMVADVDPSTGLIRRSDVERCLAAHPRALVLHYPLGFLPESDDLFGLGLPVLEDISQAFSGRLGEVRCGSLGQVSVLRLGPEGIITAGSGAAVFCRDRRILKALREAAEREPKDLMLADMNAALGLAQLREIDSFLKTRQAIAELFTQAVSRSRHGTLSCGHEGGSIPFSFPVMVKDGAKQVQQYAMKKGVETHNAFSNSIIAVGQSGTSDWQPSQAPSSPRTEETSCRTAAEPVSQSSTQGAFHFPIARDLLWRCLLFPLYPTLGKKDAQLIAKVLSTLP